MTITTVTLDDTKIGQVISPGPDQFIARMTMIQDQSPAWQIENWVPLPYPFGQWKSGRLVLRDLGGAGRRLISLATQTGALVSGPVAMTNGQTFGFRGDLVLECLPQNQVWEIDFSDVPLLALRAA